MRRGDLRDAPEFAPCLIAAQLVEHGRPVRVFHVVRHMVARDERGQQIRPPASAHAGGDALPHVAVSGFVRGAQKATVEIKGFVLLPLRGQDEEQRALIRIARRVAFFQGDFAGAFLLMLDDKGADGVTRRRASGVGHEIEQAHGVAAFQTVMRVRNHGAEQGDEARLQFRRAREILGGEDDALRLEMVMQRHQPAERVAGGGMAVMSAFRQRFQNQLFELVAVLMRREVG